MKLVKHMWMNHGRICMVKCLDEYGEYKTYIHAFSDDETLNPDACIKHTMDWGSTVHEDTMKNFF